MKHEDGAVLPADEGRIDLPVVAHRCTWDDYGDVQYHDSSDPLPSCWDDERPDEVAALVLAVDARAEIARLRTALRQVAQANAWLAFGECRSFGADVPVLSPSDADALARVALGSPMIGHTATDMPPLEPAVGAQVGRRVRRLVGEAKGNDDGKSELAKKCLRELRAALSEADRIMGHDDEATEWREVWAGLWDSQASRAAEEANSAERQKALPAELETAYLLGVLERIATPVRADGTYNLCREACGVLARETLVKVRHNA